MKELIQSERPMWTAKYFEFFYPRAYILFRIFDKIVLILRNFELSQKVLAPHGPIFLNNCFLDGIENMKIHVWLFSFIAT